MTPLFFGHGARRMFGVYTPASAGTTTQPRAVVLCHPWGQEYLRAHRSMAQLAVMLSDAGFHVMRFDYFGTGDSNGDMKEADVEGWIDDVMAAIQEIQDTTGAERVRLIGLRLGASLAAMAAARHPDEVEALVLWDPVISGGSYLQELLATEAWTAHGTVGAPVRSARDGGGHEVLGFPLTAELAEGIRRVELAPLVSRLTARVLTLATTPLPAAHQLCRALQDRAPGTVEFEEVPSSPAWLEDSNTGAGAIPTQAMQRIVRWMQ
jgi:exosortase A-associated hydrolase 2